METKAKPNWVAMQMNEKMKHKVAIWSFLDFWKLLRLRKKLLLQKLHE